MKRFLITLVIALAGGALFTLIHSPLPWLLGPMVFAFLGTRLQKKIKPLWPGYLRNTALIIIGYSIGLSFTVQTLKEMGQQLPNMILLTVLLLLLSALIAYGVSKLSGLPFPTVLMGSIPGGLSQMIIIAEDTRGIDLTVVTFLQVSRLMMIIFCVPLLVFSPLFGSTHSAVTEAAEAVPQWGDLFPGILLFAAVCVIAGYYGNKIRFPSAYLLGPMFATAALHLSGVHGPALPSACLDVAQLLIGTYVGLLRPETLTRKVRVVCLAILSGAVLILGALGLSALLTRLHGVSAATAFLAMAPGGMDQMGIMAKEIDANIAVVSCYQLFRTWFIFFAVPPLLKLAFKRWMPAKGPGRDEVHGEV
ncbi:AbrB family transcriptional regulator [Paenibacillus sp. GCM10023248]|uniref:AbrB family transcriptional regulator n=1 Tax=unclassified Paenibacillus TaxID=185978 RepID=UPI00237846C2|nr:AbrB family transcriptional regulator [Paenibacillus sp. MAHUQ-63]MDD9271656.1 AbrB family transcriptional regulator [Paenibacillus sp. MAHUQ-63]